MRIVVNGWFWEQLTTGSGQYLAALAAWLPVVDGGHEFVLIRHGKSVPRIDERAASISPGLSALASGPPWTVVEAPTPFDALSPNLAKVWFEQLTFPWHCRRLRANIALVPYWGSPWWRPCPVAVTVHDLIPLLLPAYRGGPAQRAYVWVVTRSARRAEVVLTDSQAAGRDIVARLGIPAERVHAVHLAAGPEYRRVEDGQELDRVRARYRLPAGPFFIYLGGFDVRKNVVRVVEAYGRLVASARPAEALPKSGAGGPAPGV